MNEKQTQPHLFANGGEKMPSHQRDQGPLGFALGKSKFNYKKAIFAVLLWVPIGMAIPQFLTFSRSESMGHPFFLMWPALSTKITRGEIVRFPHRDLVTDNKTVFMLKRVGCTEGRTLSVNDNNEYFCDGDYLGKAKERNSKGALVKHFVWNGAVPQGLFFAVANHKDSYDSRYYGFVPAKNIKQKAVPLF